MANAVLTWMTTPLVAISLQRLALLDGTTTPKKSTAEPCGPHALVQVSSGRGNYSALLLPPASVAIPVA
jgi:hypothetical protein